MASTKHLTLGRAQPCTVADPPPLNYGATCLHSITARQARRPPGATDRRESRTRSAVDSRCRRGGFPLGGQTREIVGDGGQFAIDRDGAAKGSGE